MGSNDWKRSAPFYDKLGKDPTWACSGCSVKNNWFKRAFCRCGREPPAAVCRAQRQAMDRGSSENGRGRSRERGGGEGGGGGGGGARRYADVARSSNDQHSRKLDREIGELRRQLAAERKEKEELQRLAVAAKSADKDGDIDIEEEAEATSEEKDARIQLIANHLKGIGAVLGEDSKAYQDSKAEHDRLVKERREAKPLKVQLQHVERKLEKQRAKVEKGTEEARKLAKAIQEMQGDLDDTNKELQESQSTLAALEKERKDLLLREAQGDDDGGGSGGGGGPAAGAAAGQVSDVQAWQHVVHAISNRTQQPGVQPEVASQVNAVLHTLQALLAQLGNGAATAQPQPQQEGAGAVAPRAESNGAAAAAASGGEAGGGAGAGQRAEQLAAEVEAQRQAQLQQQQREQATVAVVAETTAAAPAASASSGGTELGGEPGNADDRGDSGSDPETECGMDVEGAIAGIPEAQRTKIRDMLVRRRTKTSGQRRLRHPGDEGAGSNPKKPCKEG